MSTLFWKRHPALLAGFFLFLGTLFALSKSPAVVLAAAIFASCAYRLIHFFALSFFLGFFYTATTVQVPPNNSTIEGRGLCEIIDVISICEHNKAAFKLVLRMKKFEGTRISQNSDVPKSEVLKETREYQKVSNTIVNAFWRKENRPQASFLYEVSGTLETSDSGSIFRTKKLTVWKPVSTVFSCTEWRVKAREKAILFFRKYLPPGEVRNFLEGISTGQIQDKILSEQLRYFGLSHIIVVSGFHFSILTAFFALFLRFFFPWKVLNIVLLVVVMLYLGFIGPTPSVARAFVSTFVLILGRAFEKRSCALNSLGLGACVLLLYNPLWAMHIGFCLSFLATFAILLLVQPIQHFVDNIFPKRELSQVLALSFYDTLCHLLFSFVRQAMVLSCAVHLMMIPLILFLFGSFPLFGFIYNLFFPLCTALAMVFLYLGWITALVPYICPLCMALSYMIAEWALRFVMYAPEVMMSGTVRCELNPYQFCIIQSLIVVWGIYLYHNMQLEEESQLFNYL